MKGTGEWDYVIAGGGTAGCVLASRLTEKSGTSVLLLEAGGEYARMALEAPLPGMRNTFRYSWKYFARQQAGLGHRRICYPVGKLLGGSSSVNAMMYCRGAAAAFDRWGMSGWSYEDVLPYFRRAEDQERGASLHHGVGGPMAVSDPRHRAPFSEAFVEACLERGLPLNDDFNGYGQEGAGFFQVTQRRGRRVSTAGAYLSAARRRRELRVETHALVCRVEIEGRRACGVEYVDREGRRRVARAAREVILCAGAFNTPQILMVSGIGPAAELKRHGIPVVAELAGVGANLQDHVRIPVLYQSDRPSPGDMRYWIPGAAEYALRGRGVMTSNCCEAGAYLRSGPDQALPDLQFVTHFQSGLVAETVDLQFCLAETKSRGTVTLASADPAAPPVIDPNLLAEDEDVRRAVAGLRIARDLAGTRALQRFPLGGEVLPGRDLTTDLELERYARSMAETCYHPAGACRMGTGDEAVVDAELRVRGVEGLRVADASIMPQLPNGNTAAAVVMIAEKAAAMLSGRGRGRLENGHAGPV